MPSAILLAPAVLGSPPPWFTTWATAGPPSASQRCGLVLAKGLRRCSSGCRGGPMANDPSATIVSLFASRIAADAPRPALSFRRDGAWQTRTWSELADDVRRTAAVLVEL